MGPTYYLDRFLHRYQIAGDLIALGLYPDAKEITESYGAYRGLIKNGIDRLNSDVIVFVVGDGVVPRTGALLAFKTKWTIFSIDSSMKIEKYCDMTLQEDAYPFDDGSGIQYFGRKTQTVERLYLKKGKIECIKIPNIIINKFTTQIIVHVHSHAYLTNSIKSIYNKNDMAIRLVLSIPCCIPDNLTIPCLSYIDRFILSEKNRVNLYPIQNMILTVGGNHG